MKRIKLLAAILGMGLAHLVGPAQANAYLYVDEAQNKAKVNTWNNFCSASYSWCWDYPSVYQPAQRLSSATVDTFITVHRKDYGRCYRRIRVTETGGLRVMDGQSGYWSCPY